MSPIDRSRLTDTASAQDMGVVHTPIRWRCLVECVDRYVTASRGKVPGDTVTQVHEGNLLLDGGGSVLWERLITRAASTSSTGAALQAYSSGNAKIGVGASTVAAAATQTGLQTTGTKWFKGMSSGYPSHTDGTSSSGARGVVFRSLFATSEANISWQEAGVFNSSGGRMLQRSVSSFGTKSSSVTRQITVTLSLA